MWNVDRFLGVSDIGTKLFIITRILMVLAICVLIATFIAIFWIPLGQFFYIFGSAMMLLGLSLIILGGAMGAGGFFKALHRSWVRSQRRALQGEMKNYHKDRKEYTTYGFYLALSGILAWVIGLIPFFF